MGEENRVDQAVFCSFVSNQNVTDTDVTESSPILIKKVVVFTDGRERIKKRWALCSTSCRQDFKSGSVWGSRVTQEARVT